MPTPNERLLAARQRARSERAPGKPMGRAEVADAVRAWLLSRTGREYPFDGHYLGKLERGLVERPRDEYRAALRYVLGVGSDADLGFDPASLALKSVTSERRLSDTWPVLDPANDMDSELMDAASESATWLSLAESTNVGELTVEQLHADVRRIATSYLKAPTGPLFTRTRALRDRAFVLLEGRQRPAQTRQLYAAAGWALTLLAWMTVDLGRPDIAETHARSARVCADNADLDGLRAWVCATQHTAAFWQDDFARAAEYAAEGRQYAEGSAALYLASAEAMDLSRCHQLARAQEVLDEARHLAERFQPSFDEVGGPFQCTVGRAAGLWADTHFGLNEPTEALALTLDGLSVFDRTPVAERNAGSERMVRLQLAKAHLMLGEPDGAAEALQPVLETPPEHRVRPLLRRVGEVAELAAVEGPRRAGAITTGIRESIADFTVHARTAT
ncbi:hypothetical protein ACI2LF_24070 [Kribbella sp. NPDC020789]